VRLLDNMKQAVILAGGKGERLKPITNDIPKPMAELNGKPFLEYLISFLKKNNIEELVLLLGYKHEKIEDYFGDGLEFGVNIKYSIGNVENDTGKRLKDAYDLLDNEFLLMYCDNYCPIDIDKLYEFHKSQGRLATIVAYENSENITKNNIYVAKEGYVVKYDYKRQSNNLNGVDIGFFILNKKVVEDMPIDNISFQKHTIPILIEKEELSGHLTKHKYYSISDVDRLRITERYLRDQKVILLDRDGVINKIPKYGDYITDPSEIIYLPDVKDTIDKLHNMGFSIYVMTNQAGIGLEHIDMTIDQLEAVHEKIYKDFDGKINQIYYCPHHWDDNCDCRKPKPGMLFQAAREHNIDLTRTIYVGDTLRDKKTALRAGCDYLIIKNSVKEIFNEIEKNKYKWSI